MVVHAAHFRIKSVEFNRVMGKQEALYMERFAARKKAFTTKNNIKVGTTTATKLSDGVMVWDNSFF